MDYNGSAKWQHDCLSSPDHKKPDAFTILDEDAYAHHHCSHNSCSDLTDADWRALWEERAGETYPWPGRRKVQTGDSGVSGADTSPETPIRMKSDTLPQDVSTCDTHAEQIRYSDAGNALRLAKTCGEDIVYCVQADEYYVWDGTRWVRDLNNVNMLRTAKAVTEHMFEEAKLLGDEEAKSLRSHALKSQSASRLAAMVTLAKLHVRNVNRGDFDKDPWLLNCLNGTIDLKAGKLRPHDRKDLMSKKAPVTHDPAADCPLWKKCLSDWMLGDAEKAAYLQRHAGYAMTGCTNEEVMPILWGAGRNGKTKFYVTIYNVLGDGEYAKATNQVRGRARTVYVGPEEPENAALFTERDCRAVCRNPDVLRSTHEKLSRGAQCSLQLRVLGFGFLLDGTGNLLGGVSRQTPISTIVHVPRSSPGMDSIA